MSNEARPFRVLGVQQIAIGGGAKSELAELWIGLFGLEQIGTFSSDAENVNEDILVAGRGPLRVEIDLMEPIDPARKPRVDVPALNHVGLWIDDLDGAYEWLEARGVRFAPGGIRVGAAGHRVCFIHPRPSPSHSRSGVGVLIELVAAPVEVVAAFDGLERKEGE